MKLPMGQGSGRTAPREEARSALGGATPLGRTSLDRDCTLQRVEAALRRLEHGRFGHCLYCGDQIRIARLEHDPAIESCDTCGQEPGGQP